MIIALVEETDEDQVEFFFAFSNNWPNSRVKCLYDVFFFDFIDPVIYCCCCCGVSIRIRRNEIWRNHAPKDIGYGHGLSTTIYYYASLSHLIQWTNRTQRRRRRRRRMKSRFKSTPKSLPKNLHLQQLPPEPLYGRVWTPCVSKWEGHQVFVHVLIENKWCRWGWGGGVGYRLF